LESKVCLPQATDRFGSPLRIIITVMAARINAATSVTEGGGFCGREVPLDNRESGTETR